MRILDMTFRSETNSIKHLKISNVANTLEADEIKAAMQEIAAMELFVDKHNFKMFVKPVSATYVVTQENAVFNVEK